MAEQKYYWIKLKTDFFDQEAIDLLLSQPNGCEYVVLYQMLCLNTANNGGEMTTRVGEMIVPYNIDKIVRDTKYFDHDTVAVALELFKKLGLVYQEENGILRIADCTKMVGSVYDDDHYKEQNRIRQQRYRDKKKLLEKRNVTVTENNNVEYRDKILDIRDKSIDIDINKEDNKEVALQLKPSAPKKPLVSKEDMQTIVDEWNKIGLARVQSLSKSRQDKIRLRVKEQGLERVLEALKHVERSSFLMGNNKQGWKCSFDWIFSNDSNIVKVLEGNYEDRPSPNKVTGNVFLRSIIKDKMKEENL